MTGRIIHGVVSIRAGDETGVQYSAVEFEAVHVSRRADLTVAHHHLEHDCWSQTSTFCSNSHIVQVVSILTHHY